MNQKGLVTIDRKLKKDAFYLYKAYWSKTPFVHVCGRRYVDRTEDVTEIKVYSNEQSVTLFVDGGERQQRALKYLNLKSRSQEHTRSGQCPVPVKMRSP